MFDSIMKAFVPGYGAQDTPQVREKSGKVAGAVGIATNLLLFAIKLAAGLLSGSVALNWQASPPTKSTPLATPASSTSPG